MSARRAGTAAAEVRKKKQQVGEEQQQVRCGEKEAAERVDSEQQ